jgi:hypothetical protein
LQRERYSSKCAWELPESGQPPAMPEGKQLETVVTATHRNGEKSIK